MDAPTLPSPFTAERLEDAVRVAQALVRGKVLTLDEVATAAALEPAQARAILRELSKSGLVTTTVMSSGSCQGRRGGPQFFYARTPAADPVFAAAAEALAAREAK